MFNVDVWQLWQLMLRMVVDGRCPTTVDTVLQVVKVKGWTTRRAVKEALALIAAVFR